MMYGNKSPDHSGGVSKRLQRAFGRRLLTLRQQAGMTQQKLSEKTGISTQHISNVEHGHREICLGGIEKLAKTFEMPVAELLKDIDRR
jgi:transcriptional regulator with XRE-family HTH domain